MDVHNDGDIRQALEDIRELLERIARATEELASCVGNGYSHMHDNRLKVSDVVH